VPRVEKDHGVEIAHPRFLSLRRFGRLSVGHNVQRQLYWRALKQEVEFFIASGGRIVHVRSGGLPGVLLDRIKPAKLVVSMWDDELFDVAPARKAVRKALVHTLRTADSVVYISKTLHKVGTELAGPHAGCVIPLGIDEYADLTPEPNAAFTVLTAGRLIPRKKIGLLIEAFASFHAFAPEARLLVVGDGPERRRLENTVQACGVVDAVDFTGNVSHRRVLEHMARAHLFVLPSVQESLGTVYFEAMAMRVPVVGVRGEGISDYVTDGFLVPPDDSTAIVKVMRTMYDQPERRQQIGDMGHALFDRSGVRWHDYVTAHLELFERLL
jgi:glycosyltransferase involved in cell wall biosynthesis